VGDLFKVTSIHEQSYRVTLPNVIFHVHVTYTNVTARRRVRFFRFWRPRPDDEQTYKLRVMSRKTLNPNGPGM